MMMTIMMRINEKHQHDSTLPPLLLIILLNNWLLFRCGGGWWWWSCWCGWWSSWGMRRMMEAEGKESVIQFCAFCVVVLLLFCFLLLILLTLPDVMVNSTSCIMINICSGPWFKLPIITPLLLWGVVVTERIEACDDVRTDRSEVEVDDDDNHD